MYVLLLLHGLYSSCLDKYKFFNTSSFIFFFPVNFQASKSPFLYNWLFFGEIHYSIVIIFMKIVEERFLWHMDKLIIDKK